MYCDGNTEEVLGELQVNTLPPHFHVHTKAFPFKAGDHEPEKLKEMFFKSLTALRVPTLQVFYLHAPDHTVPYERTLRAVNDLHAQGLFLEFGLSNYSAWEVMQIHWICMYNAVTRDVERELFPCLRELGIRFYAYNPLCGGVLTGFHNMDTKVDPGSPGVKYRTRYWNTTYFDAITRIKSMVSQHDITMVSAAHRWFGDGVIVGVSSYEQAVENLGVCEEGPLPEVWRVVKALAPAYCR
ncbi:NADP-dependent oxidoreductase domain-containing protein [Chytridium lagenaria]|nr:NADP-dependent oxidoreductase domain-containing protein [Chytridium lagenaria]